MYDKIKFNVKEKMQGSTVKIFLLSVAKFIIGLTVVLCFGGSVYFSVERKQILGIGIYYVIPILSVAGIILFYLTLKVKLKLNSLCYSLFDSGIIKNGFTLRLCVKYLILHLIIYIRKFGLFCFFMSPFTMLSVFIYYLLKNGVNGYVFVCFCIGAFVMFLIGSIYFIKSVQIYNFIDYSFYKNRNSEMKNIISNGIRLSDGRCNEFVKLKVNSGKYFIADLFIIPCFYYIPYVKMINTCFICAGESEQKKSKAIVYLAVAQNNCGKNYKSRIVRGDV